MIDLISRRALASAMMALAVLGAPIAFTAPSFCAEAVLASAGTQPRPQTRSDVRQAHHRRRHAPVPAAQPTSLRLPRATVPPTESAAPVPNEDVLPPADRSTPEANVAPDVFALHYPSSGEGYISGSSPSSIDNEHAAQIGGVQLQVPLK